MSFSRRDLLRVSSTAAVGSMFVQDSHVGAAADDPVPAAIAALKPRLDGAIPISLDERKARVAKAQELLGRTGLDALVIASGTSLEYFTGAEWGLSERFFGVVISKTGEPGWVTPAFEKLRGLEQILIGSDVRAWEEDESPYALVAAILKDRNATGRVGIEETMPFVFADEIGKAVPGTRLESGTPVSAGCRMIKDAHEIALMRRACEITVLAHRAVFASLREGMSRDEVASLSVSAHRALGVRGGSLVLFGPDAAFPHGTTKPQPLKAGDMVLLDGGCSVHGYSSDITRTGIFGATPTARQRRIWDTVRAAQDAAFEAARPGALCQAVDAAARSVIEKAGFGANYKGMTHRVGHGIGMDGHEWTYLVRGNKTVLQPGMCFSDEPGIYIPGEIGIRHEDIIHITPGGAENLTAWTKSPEDPAVV